MILSNSRSRVWLNVFYRLSLLERGNNRFIIQFIHTTYWKQLNGNRVVIRLLNSFGWKSIFVTTSWTISWTNHHSFKEFTVLTIELSSSLLDSEGLLPTLEQTHLDSTPKCNLRSRVRWFTEFCNSHDLSQFAALFIDLGTKVSTVISCLGYSIILF